MNDFVCVIFTTYVDITVSFMNPRYNIIENDGTMQFVLVLTNPSSTNITLQVINEDNTATGK